MLSAIHHPTSDSHYRQSSTSPTSLEESTEADHAHYHHSNDALPGAVIPPFDVGDLLQPSGEAQKILWEVEAHRRQATGQHGLHPRSDRWVTKGRTIYNAHSRPALSWRKEHGKEPKTPVRNAKQPALLPARANVCPQMPFFTIPNQAEAGTGKSLHIGVSEALVEVMQTRYSSPDSNIDPSASPCPSTTPSLTYSDGSESGEEDTPSIDIDTPQGSPLGIDDCLVMDYESPSSAYYYEQVSQCPPLIKNLDAEIVNLNANLNAAFQVKQEEMAVAQQADMLFMEFINVDSYMDVPMDY